MRGLAGNVTLAKQGAEDLTSVFEGGQIFGGYLNLPLSPSEGDLSFAFKCQVHTFTRKGLVWTTTLNLTANNLTGPIPNDFLKLQYLKVLNLSRNYFSGRIPDGPSSFPNLESLDLFTNQHTGFFHNMLASMKCIQVFYLGGNDLSGEIPQENGFGTHWRPENFMPGNEGLCGPPLAKQCPLDASPSWMEANMSGPGFCVGMIMCFGGITLATRLSSPLHKSRPEQDMRHQQRQYGTATRSGKGNTLRWMLGRNGIGFNLRLLT